MTMKPLPIIVQLIHIHGPMKGEIQEFDRKEILIGRHPSCDLQFPKDLAVISRKHAVIVREGNRFKIVDTSTNGTFVNGSRINETWLKNGDVIFFTQGGPKVSFLTREGESVQAAAAPLTVEQPQQYDDAAAEKQAPPRPPPLKPQAPPRSTAPPQTSPREEITRVPLVIQYGPVLKSFTELPITIGTQVDCDLVLDHTSLSPRHARIFFSQGGYMVKDLTGSSRMQINNRQITAPSPLNPGDRLFLTESGPAFQFMEGGRMAEINISPSETATPVENNIPEESGQMEKKSGSFFQKMFNRTT
jgi:pSer/pThr/pTyr-binding forkhead associated (FHA) protein